MSHPRLLAALCGALLCAPSLLVALAARKFARRPPSTSTVDKLRQSPGDRAGLRGGFSRCGLAGPGDAPLQSPRWGFWACALGGDSGHRVTALPPPGMRLTHNDKGIRCVGPLFSRLKNEARALDFRTPSP
ncbi:hypothetical protein P7K49_012624 [Saguinus oedipus]|uniref:Uncharacterized protein n=1 Tax=Saguinus oedipus TaxID=9490 RepID=A0ABQ9VDM7_SAGOE|nr:hypothetical protein P7K49_012624 [Saguinus oedipus]